MNAPHYGSREPRHDPRCECGHGKRYHPNVGRIASWPTRCLHCDCKGFTAAPAGAAGAAEVQADPTTDQETP